MQPAGARLRPDGPMQPAFFNALHRSPLTATLAWALRWGVDMTLAGNPVLRSVCGGSRHRTFCGTLGRDPSCSIWPSTVLHRTFEEPKVIRHEQACEETGWRIQSPRRPHPRAKGRIRTSCQRNAGSGQVVAALSGGTRANTGVTKVRPNTEVPEAAGRNLYRKTIRYSPRCSVGHRVAQDSARWSTVG